VGVSIAYLNELKTMACDFGERIYHSLCGVLPLFALRG
jgi:hypothetical protein